MPVFDPRKPVRKIRYRCRICGLEEVEIWNMPDNPLTKVPVDETIRIASCDECFRKPRTIKAFNRIWHKVDAPAS